MKYSALIRFLFILLSSLTSGNFNYGGYDPANCLDDLDVPTSFTPNGDSLNDFFAIPFPCDPQSFEIEIFDRYEVELFVSKDFNFVWYGRDKNGLECQNDVYDWKIRNMYQMNYVEVSGQVLLMR